MYADAHSSPINGSYRDFKSHQQTAEMGSAVAAFALTSTERARTLRRKGHYRSVSKANHQPPNQLSSICHQIVGHGSSNEGDSNDKLLPDCGHDVPPLVKLIILML